MDKDTHFCTCGATVKEQKPTEVSKMCLSGVLSQIDKCIGVSSTNHKCEFTLPAVLPNLSP
jgi:hypothetical protein